MKERNVEEGRKSFAFRAARVVVKILYHRPKFIFLDGDGFIDGPSIFIVNHSGSHTPTRVECYFPRDLYMWGTHEMTEGLKAVHHYLIHIYYHQKKHFKMFWARIIGTIFCPFANAFYKGMRIIPTYRDGRLMQTFKETEQHINKGEILVIYPEDSSQGYKDEPDKVFNGFLVFAQMMLRKGKDLPIYTAHYQKKGKKFIIDKPRYYSELLKEYGDHDAVAEALRLRMNSLKAD